MATSPKNRARMGYLNKADIQTKIQSGALDAYDWVVTADSQELYIISPELDIVPVKTHMGVYDTEAEALQAIKKSSGTYIGQMVMIYTGEDGYKPYVVNLAGNNQYYLTPVTSGHSQAIIDYNLAENTPIKNVTSNAEILLTNLADGYYSVTGSYRICEGDATHRIATSPIMYIISEDKATSGTYYIMECGAFRTMLYVVIDGELSTDTYIKSSELDSRVSGIMDSKFNNLFDTRMDETFDEKFDEKVDDGNTVATTGEIEDLFE